jgi:hypothetical protein
MTPSRLQASLVLATTLIVGAYGGGGEDTAPVPPGPPTTQSVDATGGKTARAEPAR